MSDTLTSQLFFLFLVHILLSHNLHGFIELLRKTITLDLITIFGIVAAIREKFVWSTNLHLAAVVEIE
jgi:hypothetical protein